MTDDKGPDAKIVCVPAQDPRWGDVNDIEDVPELLRAEIEHFFEVYKTLEPGKSSNTSGYDGVDAAWHEIEAALERLTREG
jgi:inorganic pyrophosphatase